MIKEMVSPCDPPYDKGQSLKLKVKYHTRYLTII